MKPVIGSLLLLLVFLMVIHSFWKWSRQFPPAHEREPSGVAGLVWAMLRLLSGRTPSVRLEASLGCLASGPGAEAWMLQTGAGDISRFAVSIVLTAGAILYLYLSPRSKHTYG